MNVRRAAVVALALSAVLLSLAGCSKSTSVTNPVQLNSTPPAAPSNLVGLFDVNQQQDYLIWTASSSANVATYEVWQYDGDPTVGNTGTLVGTVASGSSYLGLPRPSQNSIVYYRMRARSVEGTPSAFSATIHLQRHGAAAQPSMDPGTGGDPNPLHQ